MSVIRMIIAEQLLGFALSIAPKNDDGKRLAKHISAYLSEAMREAL